MTATGLERRVLDAVDLDALLEDLDALVSIPSLGDTAEERHAQEAMASRMESLGLATDVWEIDFDRLRSHPAYAVDLERDEGLGVVGSAGAGEGPALALNGHVDVVTAGEPGGWRFPPWRATREGGRVYGRGTADMKGGLCCALGAVRALRDAGVRLRGSLQVQSVVGEEDGGAGTLATVLRGHRADGAIVLEPTRLAVAPAQAGALSFRVTVPGRAAHGAFREEGVDPVEKALPLLRRLRALEEARNRDVRDPMFAGEDLPFALAIGRVRAGEWPSTVAERLVFEGRYGVAPDEEAAAARAALEAAIAEVAEGDPWLREHPPVVEWRGAQFHGARTPADDPVVTTTRDALRDATGREPVVRGMRYGADMRLLVDPGGVPTVLFGPGDVRDAHRPDEGVELAELEAVTRTLALAAMRFCGVAR